MQIEDFKFKKQFGQNFLSKVNWGIKFMENAQIDQDDLVIEIGPGNGFFTDFLAQKAQKVIAIEIDTSLKPFHDVLKDRYPNLEFIYQDILSVDVDKLTKGQTYKVVGSLPYNISKRIIKQFIELDNPPELMLFIVQREVGQKYAAKAPKTNFLAMYANLYADIEYIETIPKTDFFPIPEVDGGMILFTNIKQKFNKPKELTRFIKLGSTQPRKTLLNNLSNYNFSKTDILKALKQIKLSEKIRSGELSLSNWIALFEILCK